MSLADKLAGKKVLVTGITGFVGEALLHRMLGQAIAPERPALFAASGQKTGVLA